MNRKIWTLEEKIGVVLAMLKGEESVAAVCMPTKRLNNIIRIVFHHSNIFVFLVAEVTG